MLLYANTFFIFCVGSTIFLQHQQHYKNCYESSCCACETNDQSWCHCLLSIDWSSEGILLGTLQFCTFLQKLPFYYSKVIFWIFWFYTVKWYFFTGNWVHISSKKYVHCWEHQSYLPASFLQSHGHYWECKSRFLSILGKKSKRFCVSII